MVRFRAGGLVPAIVRERYELKLALTLVVITLLLAGIGIAGTLAVREDIAATVTDEYTAVASQEAQKLTLWHENNRDLTRTMSDAGDLTGGDPASVRAFLHGQKAAHGDHIQDIHYVNRTSERVEVSTNEGMERLPLGDIDAPWSDIENRSTSDVAATGVYRALETAENQPLIAYTAPITGADGQYDRQLVVTIRPSSYTSNFQSTDGTQTMVVDRDGRIVFTHQYVALSEYAPDGQGTDPLQQARSAGPSAPGTMRTAATESVADALGLDRGANVVVGYDQIADTGWTVLVHTPVSQAFGTVTDVTVVGLAGTLGAIVVVAIVGYYIGRDTADAINGLSEKAGTLETGDYDVDFSTDRVDNLGRLSDQFGSMAAALREREQSLQAEHDRFVALFENSSDCIVRVEFENGDPVIRAVNQRFEDRFGYDSAAVAGASLVDLVAPDEQTSELDEILAKVRRGERVERELHHETADGDGVFLTRFVPITDGTEPRPTDGYVVYTDVTERTETQRTLEANNRTLQRLHEVTTDPGDDVEDAIERLLELGCERFDLEVGILSRIEDDEYEVVEVVDSAGAITTGDCFDIGSTPCEITISGDLTDVLALPDIGASEYENHPAYQQGIAAAYIGTPVIVDGETYGTVNFSSQSPNAGEFTESQREVVKLIAQWVGTEIEREQRQTELRRSRELLEQSQRLASVGAWELDVETSELRVTDEVNRILERPLDEPLGLEPGIEFYHPDDQQRLREGVKRAIESNEPYDMEVRFTTDTGDERWARAIGVPVQEDEAVVKLQGVMQDITDRKEHEQELELAETLHENTQDVLFVVDVDEERDEYRLERVNPAYEAQTGLESEDVCGRDVRAVFGDDGEQMVQRYEECLARREPIMYEEEVSVPETEQVWETQIAPVVIDGEVPQLVGATHNITDRKRYQEELDRQRHLLERTQELAHVGGWELDIQGEPPYSGTLTDEVKRIHGLATDETFDMERGIEFYHPEDRPRVRAAVERAIETGESYDIEARLLTTTGEERWVRTTSEPVTEDGEIRKLRGALQDITERKEREQTLEATTDRLDSVVSNVPMILYALDTDGTFTLSEGRGLGKLGLDAGEVVGESVFDVYGDNTAIVRTVERALVGERVSETIEIEDIIFESTYEPVVDDDGEVTGVIGVAFDITERTQHERALRKTNRQLNALVENTSESVYIKDTTGAYQLMNEAAAGLFELDPEEVVGKCDEDLFDAETAADIRAQDERVMQTGEQVNEELVTVIDGEETVFLNDKFPYRDADGDIIGVMGISRDITERKANEEERERQRYRLEQTQKLAHVGGWELDLRSETLRWTDEVYRIHELPLDYEPTLDDGIDFYHPDDRAVIEDALDRCTTAGEGYDLELRKVSDTGSVRWVRTRGQPWYDDGNLIGARGTFQDITERKEREQELELAETMFENTQDVLFVLDVDEDEFHFQRVNPAYETEVGLSGEEVRDRDPRDVFGAEEGGAIVRRYRECIDRREPLRCEEHVSVPEEGGVWETQYAPVVIDGTVKQILGSSRNITERKRHEEELERQRYLLEETQALARIGGWEIDLRTEQPHDVLQTDELKRIHEIPLDRSLDLEESMTFYPPDEQQRVGEIVERAIQTGDPFEFESRFVTATGRERWIRASGESVSEDGEIVTLRGAFQDITERKQYELALQSLHEATRDLLHTESEADICDLVVDIAEDVIDVPGVAVHLLDADANAFVPTRFSPRFVDLCPGTPSLPVGDDESPVWTAFITDETVTVDDASELQWLAASDQRADSIHTSTRVDPATLPETADQRIQQGLFVPIGDHGVFTVLSAAAEIDSRTRQLVETLVATTEAAFDRLESEASLREQETELQARNDRLERQMQITNIIRTVDQSLVEATSREEAQTAVCERLVESDRIAFAWIGSSNITDETVVPQTWAGDGHRYLDRISVSGDSEPAWQTAETGSATVVERVVDGIRSEPWRRDALEHGFQSVVSVPIRHDEYDYGVLTAYVSEANAFNDLEQSVLVELGETIGNAINAIETKAALYGDNAIELKLRFSDEESLLLKLANEASCRVEFEGLSAGSAETTRLFFEVAGAAPDEVTAILDRLVAVSEYREITSTDDGGHFEAAVSGGLVAETLVTQGVRPRSIVAEDGSMVVVLDIPGSIDVREFVQLLQERYQSAELVARRDVERSIGTKADLVESLLATLTDRQRETLTTAYYSGFFEWPRDTTGEEVATMLGVSQPTVNRHLRMGQRALLGHLFDSEHHSTVAPV